MYKDKMERFDKLTFCFVCFVLITGSSDRSAMAQHKLDSEIIITIEREACFGSCPVYSAQIYADGTVVYDGEEFVKVKGKKQHIISRENLKKIIQAFEQIKYFSLKDKYASAENGMKGPTDLPTTTTSIFLNGKRKKVVNYFGAPKELDELENTIDKIAGLSEYIGAAKN